MSCAHALILAGWDVVVVDKTCGPTWDSWGNERELEIPTSDLTCNQNPLCLLEPKAKRNSIHTNKIKHSTLIKNIDELIMVVMKEKSNFTGKNDDEKITHVLNPLLSQSKF